MTNPYVHGGPLMVGPCEDHTDHFPHIEGDDEAAFLCRGVNPTSAVAIARQRAVEMALGLYDEPEEEIDPGAWTGRGPASDDHLHLMIDWNMTNHAPANADVVARFEAVREFAKSYAHAIVALCPASRDRDIAMERVEDSLMRAVASIARNQRGLEPFLHNDFEDSFLPDSRVCICPPGEDEGTYVPTEGCPVHAPRSEPQPVLTVEGLEEAAAEALVRGHHGPAYDHDHDDFGLHTHDEDGRPEHTGISAEVGDSDISIDVPIAPEEDH